MLAMDPAAR